ncbi:MAG TPA: hypothetical protein VIN35_11605 [Hydrogenophaga sp.]
MTLSRSIQTLATTLFVAALTACGGGSSDDAIKAEPTGGALPNVWFADSDGYYPLDKLKADGSFYTESDGGFGTVNPAYTAGNTQHSRWAIDTSASVEGGYALQYTMRVDSINTTKGAIDRLLKNLQIDSASGLITQYCSGFPNCYENTSGAEEDFLVTVAAKVVGGKGVLERNFILRVR